MWLIASAALLLAARIAVSVLPSGTQPGAAGGVAWVSVTSAGAFARSTGRPILLLFTDEASAEGRRLDEMLAQPKLAGRINRDVVPVRISLPGTEAEKDIAATLRRQYHVQGLPTLVFVDASGVERTRVEGVRDEAYLEKVLDRLR